VRRRSELADDMTANEGRSGAELALEPSRGSLAPAMSTTYLTYARVTRSGDGRIFLRPRPLAVCPGSFVLLPLLPRTSQPRPLPPEVWTFILEYTMLVEGGNKAGHGTETRLLTVSKSFKVFSSRSSSHFITY
jgi:hypothetical protein